MFFEMGLRYPASVGLSVVDCVFSRNYCLAYVAPSYLCFELGLCQALASSSVLLCIYQ